jgi:hypothetical protein
MPPPKAFSLLAGMPGLCPDAVAGLESLLRRRGEL